METEEIVFVALIATLLLVWAAWTFVPRDSRFMQFWIDLTGRRVAAPPSTSIDRHDDRGNDAP